MTAVSAPSPLPPPPPHLCSLIPDPAVARMDATKMNPWRVHYGASRTNGASALISNGDLCNHSDPPPLSRSPTPHPALGAFFHSAVLANEGSFPGLRCPTEPCIPSALFLLLRERWARGPILLLGQVGRGRGGSAGLYICCFSFFFCGRSRTWVEKLVGESKAAELALASPRCTAPAPSVVACQRVGGGWGVNEGVQRWPTVPGCPTGNDWKACAISEPH